MQNRTVPAVPVPLTTQVANIVSPPQTTGGLGTNGLPCYVLITQVSIVNTTTAAIGVSFWLGATGASAAGTEVIGSKLSVPPNDRHDAHFPYGLRVDYGLYLTGKAEATGLTALILGEIGVA